MNAAVQVTKNQRRDDRVIFCKTALAIFENEPQAIVKTSDISVSGVGISSPVQGLPKSTCWIRLKVPENHHDNKVFDVKTKVMYSVYSKDKQAFKIGLAFINPQPLLVELIKNYIIEK